MRIKIDHIADLHRDIHNRSLSYSEISRQTGIRRNTLAALDKDGAKRVPVTYLDALWTYFKTLIPALTTDDFIEFDDDESLPVDSIRGAATA